MVPFSQFFGDGSWAMGKLELSLLQLWSRLPRGQHGRPLWKVPYLAHLSMLNLMNLPLSVQLFKPTSHTTRPGICTRASWGHAVSAQPAFPSSDPNESPTLSLSCPPWRRCAHPPTWHHAIYCRTGVMAVQLLRRQESALRLCHTQRGDHMAL